MTNPVDPNLVAVDYTNRDYYSLRTALIDRMSERLKASGWSGGDPNDFGVALVESFAYMGDVMAYYVDRVANEMSLATATQRSSIVNIAKTYGYNPSGYRAANCEVTFSATLNTTIPAGTQLRGSYVDGELVIPVIFETLQSVTVAAESSETVTASHGENVALRYPAANSTDIAGEVIGVAASSAVQNQVFRLSENQVVEGSVKIFVQRGDAWEPWTEIRRIVNANPNDAVFSLTTDSDNYVYVTFGDGISGRIPTPGAVIKAQYIVGGGVRGQIPANTLKSIYAIPGVSPSDAALVSSSVTITNTVATGGLEPESIENIRKLAPYAITSLNRAVTLDDYSSLMFGGNYISKANAVADSFTSVTVYLAPYAANSKDVFPLYTYNVADYIDAWIAETPETTLSVDWENLVLPEAQRLIEGKTQIGVSVTFAPAVYVPVQVDVAYTARDEYTDEQVQAQFKAILEDKYAFENLDFDQTLFPEDIENVLKAAPGAFDVTVSLRVYADPLDEEADEAVREPLTSEPNEIFILNPTYTIAPVVEPKPEDEAADGIVLWEVNSAGIPATYADAVTASTPIDQVTPTFDPEHKVYSAYVAYDYFRVRVIASDPEASIKVGRRKAKGEFTSKKFTNLSGWETVNIQIRAANRKKKRKYKLRVRNTS